MEAMNNQKRYSFMKKLFLAKAKAAREANKVDTVAEERATIKLFKKNLLKPNSKSTFLKLYNVSFLGRLRTRAVPGSLRAVSNIHTKGNIKIIARRVTEKYHKNFFIASSVF